MSRKELLLLAGEDGFALLLISWAFVEVSYLPERLFALFHHISERSALASHDYWSSYYLLITVFLCVRITVLLLAAAWFWRCGTRVQALLTSQGNQDLVD
jgi:hypothetical protein